ncbi:heterokaryon incompatibility protein-domain-containing protein [Podospora aff. communis PSN243]|uniref:Heterokaryon incompatibility protein-domain-containing protein n=1 Tax=Podospora aff. communis PSN243 TaxID=3040156 RepID=A0AAV9GCF4_9PEZI|nr:heterokaryon incompatibility protein-domain-containing protein [Podospora aff. communis PSN243]
MPRAADYDDPDCPFCRLISEAISIAWGEGKNPSEATHSSPAQLYIQSRSPLTVSGNGNAPTHPHPRLLLAIDKQPPTSRRDRGPIGVIDRVKDRFIVAELESLPGPGANPAGNDNLLPRRQVSHSIDAGLVRLWLDECRTHRHSQPVVYTLRLIDVHDMCLRHVPEQKRDMYPYTALSYVWGQLSGSEGKEPGKVIPILLSTQANLAALTQPGSLTSEPVDVPGGGRVTRTVRDAMELTRKIGYRYLWVDRLCIIQDCEQDKETVIAGMSHIYKSAALTRIAAEGRDSDAGLHGVSPRVGRPVTLTTIRLSGSGPASTPRVLHLSPCLPSLCEEVRRSVWNTRGWTFQEQCLSQRCLYLTANEAFFSCPELQRREGYDYGEDRRVKGYHSTRSSVQVRTGPPCQKLGILRYQWAVQEYSRRELSYSSDVLNAFSGVFHTFSECSELSIGHSQGIPERLLGLAILWTPSEQARRRKCEQEEFSSWSWVSWVGPIEFLLESALWVPRYVSKALSKRAPLYVSISSWSYGGRRAPSLPHETANQEKGISIAQTQACLNGIGVNHDFLPPQYPSQWTSAPTPRPGELVFRGAYLPRGEFEISMPEPGAKSESADPRVCPITVSSSHTGRFRFDGDDMTTPVHTLVAVVTFMTITDRPNTASIILGLTTRNGVSTWTGVGFVVYGAKGGRVRKPRWDSAGLE